MGITAISQELFKADELMEIVDVFDAIMAAPDTYVTDERLIEV